MPDFSFEKRYRGMIAGVDEAGRGPWAGPVVAAAVILDQELFPDGLDDSKKLTAEKREELFHEIINICDFGVGIVSEIDIDNMNILNATKLAMQKAVDSMLKRPHVVLVDGNQKIYVKNIDVVTIIKGDSISLSIAAASIIAKVTRDRIMTMLSEEFPHYGWHNNFGYGTPEHIDAIEKHGICKYHRKSYASISKYLQNVLEF
jgi:ribonuclease HII